MDKKQRLHMLKQAQTPPAAPAGAAPATPATPTTAVPTTIDIRSVPNFNVNLFAAKPATIEDINGIVNIINKYLVLLSGNKVTFNMVWNNPSITGSDFSNSVKNLLNLAKWMYNVIRSRSAAYSLNGLRAIGNGLINTVKSYSFPEPNASTIQNELMTAGQKLLARLGPAGP